MERLSSHRHGFNGVSQRWNSILPKNTPQVDNTAVGRLEAIYGHAGDTHFG